MGVVFANVAISGVLEKWARIFLRILERAGLSINISFSNKRLLGSLFLVWGAGRSLEVGVVLSDVKMGGVSDRVSPQVHKTRV